MVDFPVSGVAGRMSLQTLLVWSVGASVRVVIVATQVEPGASRAAHDARVLAALQASRRP